MAATIEYPLDIDENEHAKNILKKLNSMRREEKNCDLIISVEEEKIYVNRDIMCAASDYFDTMFSHDTKEKQEGVVEMKDVQFTAVKQCIDYVYTGKIAVSGDECEGLLYSASLMQLNEVCEKISSFLEGQLNTKSFFNIRQTATKFSLESLISACDEYALLQLFNLAKEEDFSGLELDYVCFLLSSMKTSESRVMDRVLAIGLQWLKADIENREKHLIKIVNLLDLSEITPSYSKFLVENEPLCKQSPEFVRLLFMGLTASVTADSEALDMLQLSSFNPGSVPSSNSLIVFDYSCKSAQIYRPSENKLIPLTYYPENISLFFTACILGNYLYILSSNKKVFRIDFTQKNGTWKKVRDMLQKHGPQLQCTTCNNFIYVGGEHRMERYHVQGGNWEYIKLGNVPCNRSALVDYDHCIFVIGGYQNLNSLNYVTRFCPSSSTWSSMQSMNVARSSASATAFDVKIYVAGGKQDVQLRNFEMYDGVSDSWTNVSLMHSPRWLFGLRVVNKKIYAIGNSNDTCSMEVYDFLQQKWKTVQNIPKMNIAAAATVAAYTKAR